MLVAADYKFDVALGPHWFFKGAHFTCTECTDGGGFHDLHFDWCDDLIFHAQGACLNHGQVDGLTLLKTHGQETLDDLLDRATEIINFGGVYPVAYN